MNISAADFVKRALIGGIGCSLFVIGRAAPAQQSSPPLFAASDVRTSEQADNSSPPSVPDAAVTDADSPYRPVSAQDDTPAVFEPRTRDFRSGGESYELSSLYREDVVDRGGVRPSFSGMEAARERDRLLAKGDEAPLLHDYNVKIGSMLFWFDAELSLEYTDNLVGSGLQENFSDKQFRQAVNNKNEFRRLANQNSSNTREGDFIIRPQINMHGILRLTRFNTLTIDVGLGYIKFLNHSQLDSATSTIFVDPGTALSFDVKIGDVLVNIHDRPSVPQDESDLLTLRNTFTYSRFFNTAGISAVWDLNRVVLSAGYDHFNAIALQHQLDYLNQSAEEFRASASFKITDSVAAGLESQASFINYSENVQNDGSTYSAGAFLEVQVSDHIRLRLAGGYQGGQFDSNGLTEDNSSLGNYYASLGIFHNLNNYFTHNISIGHESQLGTSSNFTTVNFVRYGWNWDVLNRVSVGGNGSFEDAQESGGLFAEDIQRYNAGVYMSYALTKKLGVGLHYQFTKRTSSGNSIAGGSSLDYYENRVGVDFRYSF